MTSFLQKRYNQDELEKNDSEGRSAKLSVTHRALITFCGTTELPAGISKTFTVAPLIIFKGSFCICSKKAELLIREAKRKLQISKFCH